MTDPSTRNDTGINTIETDNVGRAEKGISKKPDNSSKSVLRHDIHAVIDAEPILDYGELERSWTRDHDVELTLSAIIAYSTGHDAEDNSSPRRDKT